METFAKLFARFRVFVYHCFDRIVIQGYLPLLTRPEHIVYFFRDVHGQYPITPQVLAQRTSEYRGWVEGYARNHKVPILKRKRARARRIASGLSATDGAAESVRGLLHLHQHGNGQHVPLPDAEVSD